ncbi:MAG: hypothetical protein GY765_40365, partial [bacterium]|nr:hypothetical protein [bacterium]
RLKGSFSEPPTATPKNGPNPAKSGKKGRCFTSTFFLVPNFDSLAVRILGVNTPTFNPRAHIQFFTDTSLQYMYGELGFKEAAVYFELPVIDLMYPYVDYSEELARQIIADGQGYYRIHILKKEL